MAIKDPISAYNAENNAEAHLLCNFLEENGIEAHVTLDESVVGLGPLGMLPGIHKPQIWIDRSNAGAATLLLAEYERDRSRRRSTEESAQDADSTIGAICEDCGKTTLFPASKNGTVQDCSHCGAYIDVGDVPEEFSDN
jgi:hypothetical protein